MATGIYERTPEHNAAISKALKGVPKPPRTPEHCANLSAAHSDVKLSPEHRAAMSVSKPPRTPKHCTALSESLKNSNAVKSNVDVMRGGQDMIWHHVAYDFLRSEALKVKITRKFHGKIHSPKGIGIHQRGYSLID